MLSCSQHVKDTKMKGKHKNNVHAVSVDVGLKKVNGGSVNQIRRYILYLCNVIRRILAYGIRKKTQKLKNSDVEKAIRIKNEYYESKKKSGATP